MGPKSDFRSWGPLQSMLVYILTDACILLLSKAQASDARSA
jgi:hypothetical protein